VRKEGFDHLVFFDREGYSARVDGGLDKAHLRLVTGDGDWVEDKLGTLSKFDLGVRLSLNLL
jgi:hypothetical protein